MWILKVSEYFRYVNYYSGGMARNDEQDATPSPRLSRAERQHQTRIALVDAGRGVFARDGFHGARLDRIAEEAGFSKGAVYSNFDSKADLFLAVMDANFELLQGANLDPFVGGSRPDEGDIFEEMMRDLRGFGLATLEFIASAARDETLRAGLAERVQVLVGAYEDVAARAAAEDESLAPAQVGVLLTAFEQGMAILSVSGAVGVDSWLQRYGMQRLLDPVRAQQNPPSAETRTSLPIMHSEEIPRTIYRHITGER